MRRTTYIYRLVNHVRKRNCSSLEPAGVDPEQSQFGRALEVTQGAAAWTGRSPWKTPSRILTPHGLPMLAKPHPYDCTWAAAGGCACASAQDKNGLYGWGKAETKIKLIYAYDRN